MNSLEHLTLEQRLCESIRLVVRGSEELATSLVSRGYTNADSRWMLDWEHWASQISEAVAKQIADAIKGSAREVAEQIIALDKSDPQAQS